MLNGASVTYGGALELNATLDYDFRMEKEFSYEGLGMSEIVKHLTKFIARLLQIHVFGEGNTRTTAVFLIKYLRKGIHETTEYLEHFLRNLLLGENNVLKNRCLLVDWQAETVH